VSRMEFQKDVNVLSRYKQLLLLDNMLTGKIRRIGNYFKKFISLLVHR
jgi:hypothetical protein